MIDVVVRVAIEEDREAIREIERRAFGGMGEAVLVDRLLESHDVVLELVAMRDETIVGHVMFSRINVVASDGGVFPGVALAPAAVMPELQGQGIGRAMITAAHDLLAAKGERLSVVLGDPSYYGRFGYSHERAAGFESSYQCEALQALAFGDAPASGKLVYAEAFQLH